MIRLAVISDLHLGDTASTLVTDNQPTRVRMAGHDVETFRQEVSDRSEIGPGYKKLRERIREQFGDEPLDYLILLGDVLDFSISDYAYAYAIGGIFFQQLKDDGLAREIIYVPGNHDFDIWHTVEYQTNVVGRLERGKLPKPFRMAVPGVIDDRQNKGGSRLQLYGVTPRPDTEQTRYAGLFLDKITQPEETPFNFAYPNLYIVTDDETVMLTHGQYLETFWSIMGDWGPRIFRGQKGFDVSEPPDMRQTVAMNFPLSQLSCSGIGQAGPLSSVIRRMEHEIKDSELDNLQLILARLRLEILEASGWVMRQVIKLAWLFGKAPLMSAVRKGQNTRYRTDFIKDPKVRRRALRYYESAMSEIGQLENEIGGTIQKPTTMIFGHTHDPVPWESSDLPPLPLPGGAELKLYNTGGWLKRTSGDGSAGGAEVFFYDSDGGFRSQRVI